MGEFLRETNYDTFTGVTERTYLNPEEGTIRVHRSEDTQKILDYNKAQANSKTDFTFLGKDHLMYPVATIPTTIIEKWLREDGIDFFSPDPDMKKKVLRKLQDPEWKYLRTDNSRLI